MPTLATYKDCTGCGACAFRCPKDCISMERDITGAKLPVIDKANCIECGGCERVCPALNLPTLSYPCKAFAAWNTNREERRTSASGGIATALYKYALEHGYVVVGASQNDDWSVTHKIADKVEDIAQFKNSRYVFSEPYKVYHEIKRYLKEGKKILMVGLPCQIAAIRNLFPSTANLILIDIVCHGIMPDSYLKQHITAIESSIGGNASRMSFRAPEKGTSNYYFTLYDESAKIIYSKRSADGDLYNIAFHRSIAYRENCYNCQYARPERVSDLTLGDYHGLGQKSPAEYSDNDLSVILVNTSKGREIIEDATSNGSIHTDERPVDEPIEGDGQLRRPSPKTVQAEDFERLIVKNKGDFEKTIVEVKRRATRRETVGKILSLPRRIAGKLKNMVCICRK